MTPLKKTVICIVAIITIFAIKSCQKEDVLINIPTNGLMAYFPFNGNTNDESGNNHNGILHGATLTTDRHQKNESAYEFDGIDDYINTFTTFDFNYRTISLWVNPNSIYESSPYNNVALVQDSPLNSYGIVGVSFGDGLLGLNAGGSTIDEMFLTNEVVENIWYHLVLVRNNSQNLYYVNGVLVHSGMAGNVASTFEPNQYLIIGAGRSTYKQFFTGKIDDVAIYNRALSQEEINTLYNFK